MLRNLHIWGLPLFRQWIRRHSCRTGDGNSQHIIFCLADHFEPMWNGVTEKVGMERVLRWVMEYPKLAEAHKDCSGRPLQHTWFYAVEQYNKKHLDALNKLCEQEFGEIELHLHHDNDTRQGFRAKLEDAKTKISQHGIFVTQESPPRSAFAFIHGDFALNNSRENGRWCGVDNELGILRQAGCYADFTLPAAPHAAQTRKVNSIYYGRDIPGRRKSHDRGVDIRAGGKATGDLMIIQGPLGLNWRNRKWGFVPRIENGCIMRTNPGTPDRIELWARQHVHVKGRPEWTFIKTHCHGAQEEDFDALLGGKAHEMFSCMEKRFIEERGFKLHYVTAREMYNIVKAAEDGREGDPALYRDYVIKRYKNTSGRPCFE